MPDILNNKAIKEALETERTFYTTMTHLYDALYHGSISYNLEYGNTNPKIFDDLQKTIGYFKDNSQQIISNLEKTISEETSLEEQDKLREQRKQHAQLFFQIYEDYSKRIYQQYAAEAKLENKEFSDQLAKTKEWLFQKTESEDISSLLIAPIQRGPRYILLINSILEQEQKPDSKVLNNQKSVALQRLSNQISASLTTVNNSMVEESPPKSGYKIGDGSRYLMNWWFGSQAPQTDSKNEPEEKNNLDYPPLY